MFTKYQSTNIPHGKSPFLWTGCTYLITTECNNPQTVLSMATTTRNKGAAKNKARSANFSYLDQLNDKSVPCMSKPVNTVTYDMKPFLKSCVDRYVQLAGDKALKLKLGHDPIP